MKITHQMLRDAGACVDQLDIFAAEWPEGAEATLANCLWAAELGLNLGWAARVVLPYADWSEYLRRCTPFWAEYDRQRAPFRAEYERQCAAVFFAIANKV